MELNWDGFKAYNGSKSRKRFQDLCQKWFIMEKVKETETPHENAFQAGIESEPVEIRTGEIANYQAKFFTVDKVDYRQFRDSFRKLPECDRKKIDVIFMCSNRNIEKRSRPFANIQKYFQKDDIRLEVFSDNDVLLWAEDKPEIVRAYWGADIPEIKRNTEIIMNNQDEFREKIDNTGTDVAEIKNYIHNLPTKSDMDRILGERHQQLDEKQGEDIEERLQYLIPKDTLANIDQTGKMLGGGAAQLKYIKDNGGWDEYHKMLIENTIMQSMPEIVDHTVDIIMEEQSRPRFKVVNGSNYD